MMGGVKCSVQEFSNQRSQGNENPIEIEAGEFQHIPCQAEAH